MDVVGDGDGGVGGEIVFAREHALRNLRHFGEVHHSGFSESNFELAGRMAQQDEAGAHNLPVVV